MRKEDAKKLTRQALLCTHVFLFLSVAVAFLVVMSSPYALPETVVRLEPAFCSAYLGQTFNVDITVVEVQDLYGLEVDVSWDALMLEIVRVDVKVGQPGGVLCSSLYIVENSTTTSQYILAATSVAPAPPFNGTGTAATITFRVKDNGNSTLNLTSQLYDFPPPDREPRISLPIEHTTLGSIFEVTIPEITSLPLFAVLVAVAVSTTILSLKKLRWPNARRLQQKAINVQKVKSEAGG